ncbi:MAG: hypothetical protein ACREOO_01595 [bacterium]
MKTGAPFYAKVDLKRVYDSIGPASRDFSQFVAIISQKMELIQPQSPDLPAEEPPSRK